MTKCNTTLSVFEHEFCNTIYGLAITKDCYLSEFLYVFCHAMYGLAATVWYDNCLFRTVNGLSYSNSCILLWLLVASSIVFGVCITWKEKHRTRVNIVADVAFPFGIYTLLSYRKTVPVLSLVLVSLSVLLTAVYVNHLLKREYRPGANRKGIICSRFKEGFLASRIIIAFSLLVLIVFLLTCSVFHIFIFSPAVPAQNCTEVNIDINTSTVKDAVELLREDQWEQLNTNEKLSCMQRFANFECVRLGISHELPVTMGLLEENVLANYSNITHVITIDVDCIENRPAGSVLNCLLHECRHAYQYQLCLLYESIDDQYKDLLLFEDVADFESEFTDYIDGTNDREAYYNQKCEADARDYATKELCYYYYDVGDMMDELLASIDYF